jgi:molybdopterin/thiamine biosynthesis adenylyltransferase
MSEDRYARHVGLFGAEGQEKIVATSVAVIGLGGLGNHVVQQLAYLGVRRFHLIDGDRVEETNLNRLLGAGEVDLGLTKVEVAERVIAQISSDSQVSSEPHHFTSAVIPSDLEQVGFLFGCVDQDPVRAALLSFTSTNRIPYLDLASDVMGDGAFGGRIVFSAEGKRCLSCLGELDQDALARAQMSDSQRSADDSIYGIDRHALDASGPSVVSVNGVVASLAVTEFMVWATGLREPRGYITYRGDLPSVGTRSDPPERGYCHYCMDFWGSSTP